MSWGDKTNLSGYIFPEVNEDKMEVIKVYCVVFGCGKILSLPESLFGNKCFEHSGVKKIGFDEETVSKDEYNRALDEVGRLQKELDKANIYIEDLSKGYDH